SALRIQYGATRYARPTSNGSPFDGSKTTRQTSESQAIRRATSAGISPNHCNQPGSPIPPGPEPLAASGIPDGSGNPSPGGAVDAAQHGNGSFAEANSGEVGRPIPGEVKPGRPALCEVNQSAEPTPVVRSGRRPAGGGGS